MGAVIRPLFPANFLGRRRSWLLISQVVLLISLYAISQFDPVAQLGTVAKLATFIAFVSQRHKILCSMLTAVRF